MDKKSPWSGNLIEVFHTSLPHWVVDYGCYAVTIRCNGSLPKTVVLQLEQINKHLENIAPQSELAEQQRRKAFFTLENFLDKGTGFAPFKDETCAKILYDVLCDYSKDGLAFSDFVIMANHIHLLSFPVSFSSVDSFRFAWNRLKKHTGFILNKKLNRSGKFWQNSWYDRWVRSEVEFKKWRKYISNNPVKARLCEYADDYKWSLSREMVN